MFASRFYSCPAILSGGYYKNSFMFAYFNAYSLLCKILSIVRKSQI